MIKDTLPVVHYFTQYDPYYFEVDNRPLKNLEARDLGLVSVLDQWEAFFDSLISEVTDAVENFVPVEGDRGDTGEQGDQGDPGVPGLDWKGPKGDPGPASSGGPTGKVVHQNLALVGPINMIEVYGHMDSSGETLYYVPAPTSEQIITIPDGYVTIGLRSVSDDGPNYKYLYLWAAPL